MFLDCLLYLINYVKILILYVIMYFYVFQPELFGLRFATKPANMHPSQRWVELSRPLKRQLDKYASDPSSLQLRVMYYVSGLGLLSDEMTR